MSFFQQGRKLIIALSLVFMLVATTACGSKTIAKPTATSPIAIERTSYSQLARGNSATGQEFGNWVVEASKGLVKDAYVRDRDKLGVIISSQVKPNEVKDLAKSLTQGFRKNFPDRDLKVLMYAPDKKLILTAVYDTQSKQIEYQQPA
ncbi:hypothetical protein [Chamaesiphon sp. GL140_3_metabinner_50]|uniref:hypothetical protein n=1 Tax=Chamaesiphon sp. GL140_3_metabinner_50 TaxID=2970812 RepID=UPI0025D9B0B1|nr:hypothetical protein [Chamaesiphon sp. GL140_3_metabinner_50]